MSDGSDPRVYFAAERTLLAWLRSGLTVIGLGFVVARFGLFLRLVTEPAVPSGPPLASTAIGVSLVLLGALMVGGAAWQHTRFCRGLGVAERPVRYWTGFVVWVSVVVAVLAVALAVYLTWTASPAQPA